MLELPFVTLCCAGPRGSAGRSGDANATFAPPAGPGPCPCGTSGRGTGIVGYNVQAVADTKHHLIVAHEVTNTGHDKDQLSNMATQGHEAIGTKKIEVIADQGYYGGPEFWPVKSPGSRPMFPGP